MRTTLFAILAAATFAPLAIGCNSASDNLDSAEAAATPPSPRTHFELAQACARNMDRHASVRPVDMQQGVIRWGCGDVPGVTNENLGQEYCEYKVVQGGAPKIKATDLAADAPLSCVFTSVFADAHLDASVSTAMADAANLGAAPATPGVIQMVTGFNSRGAATSLVHDCQGVADQYPLDLRLRNAACFQAVARGATADLTAACNTDLSKPENWAHAQELGAKIVESTDATYDAQRDIASCMAVAAAGGVMWRNSDPMICGRTSRSTTECGCVFGAVPDALDGLQFTGWVGDQIPAGCRFAKVGGENYPFVVICDVTAQEASDIPLNTLYANNLGNFCHDRFAVDLVMKLPLRALETPGSCRQTPGFCGEYMGTSQPAEPAEPTGPTTTRTTTPPTAPATKNRAQGAPANPNP